MKKIEMMGKQFGMLTVIEDAGKDSKGHLMYKCRCECGNVKNIHGTHLRSNKTISCGCKNKLNGICSDMWYNIVKGNLRLRTSRKNMEVDISKEYVFDLFLKQNGKCALSGLPITLPKRWRERLQTASLDRIDNNLGYVMGNVQWVHKHVNVMKNKFPQEMFLYICGLISNNSKVENFDDETINNFKWGLNEKYKKTK
jgi:hypothetical protein